MWSVVEGSSALTGEERGGGICSVGPMVYVRRDMAIIQFCVTVAIYRFINDIVQCKEVCVTQTSRSSADAVRHIDQS